MQDKIYDQASEVVQKVMSLSYVLTQSQQRTAQKTWISTLFLSLGLAGGLWFTTETNMPQAAQSQTVSVNLAIDRQPNETYENLLSRAEAAANAAVEKIAQNRRAIDLSIVVVANNQGEIAPILSLDVNRSELLGSNAQRSITYFNQARSLLGFDEDIAISNPARQTQNTPSTTPAPQPRTTNPTPLKQPPNSNPGTIRQGGNNTLTQPGSLVSPPASRQPTNVTPSQSGGTANPTTTPSGSTLTPGTGLNPQSPISNPVAPLNQPQNSTLPYLSPQPPAINPVAPPVNSQNQAPLNNTSPSNSNTSNPVNTPNNNGNNGNTPFNPPEITIPSQDTQDY